MTVATFSIHSPWVRNTVKFVGAVSIPAALIWGFLAAKQGADKEYESETKKMRERPTSQGTVTTDFQLKEVDDNNTLRWQLVAKKGKTADNKTVDVEDVNVKYFDGPNVKMLISAPIGRVESQTRYVKMMSAKGHRVRGEGDNGKSVFEAETIELDKKNQFIATGGVIIEWTEVAKVTGNTARGNMDKGGIKNVKVIGNTHAVIAVK